MNNHLCQVQSVLSGFSQIVQWICKASELLLTDSPGLDLHTNTDRRPAGTR